LFGQIVAGSGRKSGFAQAALAAEHQVATLGMFFEKSGERNGPPPVKLSAISYQL
jgi:hypothetical protein